MTVRALYFNRWGRCAFEAMDTVLRAHETAGTMPEGAYNMKKVFTLMLAQLSIRLHAEDSYGIQTIVSFEKC